MDEMTNDVVENIEPIVSDAEADVVSGGGLTEEEEEMWDNDDYAEFDEESDSGLDDEADQLNVDDAESNTSNTVSNADADDTDQYMELKHFDEVRKVKLGSEENKTLSQMGMDYPRVKGKLAEANVEIDRLRKYESFLNELKGDFDTIDDLMLDTRARVRADKEGITVDQARNFEMEKMAVQAAPIQQMPTEDPLILAEKMSLTFFAQNHPDVKATSIPQEVWDDFRGKTHNLEASWEKYENGKLAKENEVLKQNAKNKSRSTGSMKSSGKANMDDLDRMWYEDDY